MERLPSFHAFISGVIPSTFENPKVIGHHQMSPYPRSNLYQSSKDSISGHDFLYDSSSTNPTTPAESTSSASSRFSTPGPQALLSPHLSNQSASIEQKRPSTSDSLASASSRKRSKKSQDELCDCNSRCDFIHKPAPGIIHTALATIRWEPGRAPIHQITEHFRREVNTELKAAQLYPLGLDNDGLKRLPFPQDKLRLSATSSKSSRNDGGWSDNQKEELVARSQTAIPMLLEKLGWSLSEFHELMISDEVTKRMESNAAIARRKDPIGKHKFEGAHPDDIAKMLESGFVANKLKKGRKSSATTDEGLEGLERPVKRSKKTTASLNQNWPAAKL